MLLHGVSGQIVSLRFTVKRSDHAMIEKASTPALAIAAVPDDVHRICSMNAKAQQYSS
jgi:hypothetical protein